MFEPVRPSSSGAEPAGSSGRAAARVTPCGRPASLHSTRLFSPGASGRLPDRVGGRAVRRMTAEAHGNRCGQHDAGQATSTAGWQLRRARRESVRLRRSGGLAGHGPRSVTDFLGSPAWRAGVTPSDACGLGRAAFSAKGRVLAMLARKGGLRVAPVPPRKSAALLTRLPLRGVQNLSGRRASRQSSTPCGASNKGQFFSAFEN